MRGTNQVEPRAFYDAHKPTEWEPVASSRGIPQLTLPVIIPCEPDKADGRIYYHALNPLRIAEVPVRQLNPHELLLSDSPLWQQEQLQDAINLVNAIENDKGVAKVIHEQAGEASKEQRDQALQHPWSYAAAILNSGLYHPTTQLVVWWSDRYSDRDRRLKIGIYCRHPRAAAFALLLGTGNRTIRIGLCPKCRKRFEQDEWHPSSYCGPKCRNAASQATFRARRAAERKRKQSVAPKGKRRQVRM